ncbi:hypothetical protein [Magnetospirillum fulvum]|uniref:Uncharacterized protein n=1 Tax=Magnetospirillum fulvum TaxID=1082 RepID=A0A1H6I5J0_MAGFU|nr:hypothetical protein [Magnetospirillum fulvum]SEH43759.1 hypothetical protein SAMN04244559_02309 [Magnetospirillum fulvum]
MVTEIYSCKDGQDLREGRLDYSTDIVDREGADADARRRCQADPTLRKVAYYAVREDGGFRLIHAYSNPNWKPAGKPPRRASPPPPYPRPKAATQSPPPGLFARIRRVLGL